MSNKFIPLSLITTLLLGSSLYADDGFDDEDEFAEDEIVIEIEETSKEVDKLFSYYGSMTLSSNYRYINNKEISSAKISGNLNLEYKLDDNYKLKSTIKAYEDFKTNVNDDRDIDINELYLQGSINSNVDIKVGRQIIVWGKSDNIRITDTINPMDMTAPGMVDIKDLRLGRAISKVDYFMDNWSLSGMILHENRNSIMAENGSDYFAPNFLNIPNEPTNNIENSGVSFSLNGNLEGQDIAFYASNQYIDNKTYKSNMLGMAYNKVLGSYLFKTEVAHFDNYDSDIVENTTDGLVGIEYNGISDGSISLEAANKDEAIQYALRFTQSYINQTIDFTVLLSGYGKNIEDGGFSRIWSDYSYNDEVELSLGLIDYTGGKNQYFEKIKDNDRLFCSLKYSF